MPVSTWGTDTGSRNWDWCNMEFRSTAHQELPGTESAVAAIDVWRASQRVRPAPTPITP